MNRRLPVPPAPGPLEAYADAFDDLFSHRSQRDQFRRYLEGLLLPSERNKTFTGLANTEPGVGATDPAAQRVQWFVSESTWEAKRLNQRQLRRLTEKEMTTPVASGVLIIDETGDRKWGNQTAHVGRQWLGSIGKTDHGVVSVSSLWADQRVYYPIDVEPYTPASHFAHGKSDPAFRTKPQIALELVGQAVTAGRPFRAVVTDSFYGENAEFKAGLVDWSVGYVLALKPSHCWWHPEGTIGSVWEVAQSAVWQPDDPGAWIALKRVFRDGHEEVWWALEADAGPYGPEQPQRLVVVTTDPIQLPERSTWYLTTNLPVPDSEPATTSPWAVADLAEVVRRVSGPRRCRHSTALATGLLRLLVLLVGAGSGGHPVDRTPLGYGLRSGPGGSRKTTAIPVCQRLSRRKKSLEGGAPGSVGPRRCAKSGPGWNRI